MFTAGSFNSSVLRGLAAACNHQPRPVGMLRTPRKEEEEVVEEEEVGDIFIFPSCTAVRGGPRRAHQTLTEHERERFEVRRKAGKRDITGGICTFALIGLNDQA